MGEDIIEFDGIRDTMQGIIKVVGLGAGGDPEFGKAEAEKSIDMLRDIPPTISGFLKRNSTTTPCPVSSKNSSRISNKSNPLRATNHITKSMPMTNLGWLCRKSCPQR